MDKKNEINKIVTFPVRLKYGVNDYSNINIQINGISKMNKSFYDNFIKNFKGLFFNELYCEYWTYDLKLDKKTYLLFKEYLSNSETIVFDYSRGVNKMDLKYNEIYDIKRDLIFKLLKFENNYDIFDVEKRKYKDISDDLSSIENVKKYKNYYQELLKSEDDNVEFSEEIEEILNQMNTLLENYVSEI